MKTYKSEELSNERYHSDEFPQASGSILAAIKETCPAKFKYGVKSASKAMEFGTISHMALLEPEKFNRTYIRGIDENDHKDYLFTTLDLTKWLKESGRVGYSGKSKQELIDLIKSTGEPVRIFDEFKRQYEEGCTELGFTIVPFKDYDMVLKMRESIHLNGYGELLEGAITEFSIVSDELGLKCRIDAIKVAGEVPVIIDFKSCRSAHNEEFGAQALKLNYWLKMAVQADLFFAQYGIFPKVILLAQEKTEPYICQAYEMTQEQLEIGRAEYLEAHEMLKFCKKTNVWPAYGGGVVELETPQWAANKFGFDNDESIEITEV